MVRTLKYRKILVEKTNSPLLSLVQFMYPQFFSNIMSPSFSFSDDRTILCPTIEYVEQVNDFIPSLINGEEKTYLSQN